MISKEMILEIAKKKRLTNKEHIEKDYFQDLVLYHICKKTNQLVFKGGTCLYKLYGLPRFSEDLDFSIIGKIDSEAIVRDVANTLGAKITDVKKMKNSLIIKLVFSGILTSRNSLRIDISLSNEVFAYNVKNYVPPYIDINPFSLRALDLKEILAEKIHAILAREKARDLYDLFFLLRFVEPDKALIEKKLKLFGMSFEYGAFKKRVENSESLWIAELKPFVLAELMDFEIARDFVIEKMDGVF